MTKEVKVMENLITEAKTEALLMQSQCNEISKENAKLRNALNFYSTRENYLCNVEGDRSMVGYDNGDIAREVLGI